MFRIECTKTAGHLPAMTAWLKRDGVVVDFDTRDAAEAEAKRLREWEAVTSVFSIARVSYAVQEVA